MLYCIKSITSISELKRVMPIISISKITFSELRQNLLPFYVSPEDLHADKETSPKGPKKLSFDFGCVSPSPPEEHSAMCPSPHDTSSPSSSPLFSSAAPDGTLSLQLTFGQGDLHLKPPSLKLLQSCSTCSHSRML